MSTNDFEEGCLPESNNAAATSIPKASQDLLSNSSISTSSSVAGSSSGESSGHNPLKKQIDPLELLNCLSILLNSKGAIKSIDEVQRVAGLMGKYSKKLVSKCIYLNILQATEEPLLDEFYKETGWNLVCAWLTEAVATKNYPLAQQILSLLLVSPITIERLKRNNMPKMVKDLSKDSPHAGARDTAEKVVQRWKELVKGCTSDGPSLNRYLNSSDSHSEASNDCVRVSVTTPVPLNIVNSRVTSVVVNEKSVVERESPVPDVIDDDVAPLQVISSPVPVSDNTSFHVSPIPKLKIGRGRGLPGKGAQRGVGRGRGRRKRGTVGVGRGRGKPLVSYAELLCQDFDSTYEPKEEKGAASSVNPPVEASVPPLRITIRNGVKVLPAETKSADTVKRKRVSIDSTDSEDNKPLSKLRDECLKSSTSTEEDEKDDSEPSMNAKEDGKSEIEKEDSKRNSNNINNNNNVDDDDDDDDEIIQGRRNKKRIIDDGSDEEDDERPPVKRAPEELKENESPKRDESSDELKKKKKEEKLKTKDSKDVGDGKDKLKSKESEKRKERKSSHSDKLRGKSDREKEDEKRYKDKDRSRDKDKDRERSRHKSSRDKDRKGEKKSSSSKDKDKDRRRENEDKDKRKEQAEKDKATLDKVKPLSTEGLAKIPRKSASNSSSSKAPPNPVSFLDALGSADPDVSEAKRNATYPTVKSKSRGFRSTGLLDETIKPLGVAGKRSDSLKRQNSSSSLTSANDLIEHKKTVKASPSSAPPTGDRPGGIKLISPKRPTLSDDGGFMAALTAAGADRKKIVRKRKSSDSDGKAEGGQAKSLKAESKDSEDSIKSEEEGVSAKSSSDDDGTKKTDEKAESEVLSPTSIKPTLNFYKETLNEPSEKDQAEVDDGDDKTDPDTVADSDAAVEDESGEGLSKSESKKDDINMEIDDAEVEDKEEPMEITGGGDGEGENGCIIPFGGKEDAVEGNGGSDIKYPSETPLPAPAQEDYEKIEVIFTPTANLKGVLVYHRPQNKRKKGVRWKTDTDLKEIFYFPMDETERVNVNTVKFNEMMMMEKAREKELVFGKNRNRYLTDNVGLLDTGMLNNCIEYGPYKLYPVHLPNPSTVTPGFKSMEKHVQAQREHATMAAFFHPAMRPDTPTEPDPEMVQRVEPVNIPLKDVSGNDSICDNRGVPWPEPLFNPPAEFPFIGVPNPHQVPPPPPPQPSGGHWVLGNHTVSRFSGGPPAMFGPNGPPGPQGPGGNPGGFGPPQGFPGDIRGGWGGPTDFGGPPVLMTNGPPPPMGMPPNMVGPNPVMQGGPPMPVGPGPSMGMGGGPPPPMGNRDNYPRYRRGGGGNWGGPQGSRGYCKHFRHGHCRHGEDCKFLHVPS